MAKKRNISELSDDLKRDLERIGVLTPIETAELAKRILTSGIEIAKGNRSYLQQAANFYDQHFAEIRSGTLSYDGWANGLKSHIGKALPYQIGHSAAKDEGGRKTGVTLYDRIERELKEIKPEAAEKAIEVAREIIENPELNSVPGQEANIRTIKIIIDAYDRRAASGSGEATKYLQSKLASITNILTKSYLPNLTGHISKKKK